MSDDLETPASDAPEQRSRGKRLLGWVIGVPVAFVALLLAMHALIRPIPPTQEAPQSHLGKPCWACHIVSPTAEPVELEEQ